MDKLILDGKDYGEDYISYNRDYNNKVWEQLRMKQLHEIPKRQPRRSKIKRYRTINYCTSRSARWHKILSYVCVYLGGVALFVYGYISLIAF